MTVGSQAYLFSSPSITFSPVGSETVRSVSGVGTLTPMGPTPPPVVLSVTGYTPA